MNIFSFKTRMTAKYSDNYVIMFQRLLTKAKLARNLLGKSS
ncbi:hypothetical protein STRCR_0516 [Streptococcus criceti HS-6]|uniref:Uncharacterized protein n=1 Tax=Streptococcus criceti HS-6 TaxID=873449 RepID=G5JQD2_STRCG|nr:hypothetical protein STRCR_0516 [Streptococcus criceti HS-6]